eukprot:c21755_g1_i1 orf=240-482(+)
MQKKYLHFGDAFTTSPLEIHKTKFAVLTTNARVCSRTHQCSALLLPSARDAAGKTFEHRSLPPMVKDLKNTTNDYATFIT